MVVTSPENVICKVKQGFQETIYICCSASSTSYTKTFNKMQQPHIVTVL